MISNDIIKLLFYLLNFVNQLHDESMKNLINFVGLMRDKFY